MVNTQLYINPSKEIYHFYRPFDNGGSLTSGYRTIERLIEGMKGSKNLFGTDFDPESGVPDIDFGMLDPKDLKPISQRELIQVRTELGLSPTPTE